MEQPESTDLHLVLVEPEIPWNTGNCGRSCLAFGARLHLVRPLGFSLGAREVRRAGLDYWDRVPLSVHENWDACVAALGPRTQTWFMSAEGPRALHDAPLQGPTAFILGRESEGLPRHLRERYASQLLSIPQDRDSVRSLNLSTAAALCLYEFRRQAPPL